MPIKTWSRNSTIIPEFIGLSFVIHTAQKVHSRLLGLMGWIGHKLGEFSPTRTFYWHILQQMKKAAQDKTLQQII